MRLCEKKKLSLCHSHAADHSIRAHALNGEHVQRRFKRHPSTGSEAFFLFIRIDSNKFVLLSFCSLMKTIHPRVSTTKPLPKDAKIPNPVDVRRSKTLSWPGQSVCMEKSRSCQEGDLTMEKGWNVYCRWVTLQAESTFCFLCKSPSFERKWNMKSWLAQNSSGRRVTLLPGRFLHMNGALLPVRWPKKPNKTWVRKIRMTVRMRRTSVRPPHYAINLTVRPRDTTHRCELLLKVIRGPADNFLSFFVLEVLFRGI